eukprot:RCo006911
MAKTCALLVAVLLGLAMVSWGCPIPPCKYCCPCRGQWDLCLKNRRCCRRSAADGADWEPAVAVTDAIKELCVKVRPLAETIANETFTHFAPVSFRSPQAEAGNLYLIKVHVASEPDLFAHIDVYQDLRGELAVYAVQKGRSLSEPIHFGEPEPKQTIQTQAEN